MAERKKCNTEECDVHYWLTESKPDKIVLTGLRVDQKEKSFFVVRGKANDLDRITHVPRINFDMDNEEHAKMALQSGSVTEWQRPINSDRVDSISRFFGNPRNYLVNSVILSIPEDDELIEKNELQGGLAEITIDPSVWMTPECEVCGTKRQVETGEETRQEWFDRCPNHDCERHVEQVRPAIIIDGQHRIRGTQGEYAPQGTRDENLVATILPESDFPPTQQAEIFTEITTTAEDLDNLHKIFLLYKFQLQAPNLNLRAPMRSSVTADFQRDSEPGQRNRLAYEIACLLCLEGGPWQDRITILRERKKKGDYIDGEHLVSYISQWMEPGGIFDKYAPRKAPGLDPDPPKNQLTEYLEAIRETWPSDWNDKREPVGHVQGRGIIQVFLLLLEDIIENIDAAGKRRTKRTFKDELEKISEINWTSEWENFESPDRNKRLLLELLRSKIRGDGPADLNVAISQPPFGLEWSGRSSKLSGSITSKAPFSIEWNRPTFAYTNASLEIVQDNNILYEDQISDDQFEINDSNLSSVDTSGGEVMVRVYYSNPNGSDTIVLTFDP